MTASTSQRWPRSSKANPCLICGRTKDGDCQVSDDGLEVLCHYGKTHSPPSGLTRGDVIQGADGRDWGFTKNTKDGRTGHFTLHKPRTGKASGATVLPFRARSKARQPAPPPQPAPMPAEPPTLARMQARPAGGSPYIYSESQRIARIDKPDGSKGFRCEHLAGGRWVLGQGPDPWPAFNQTSAIGAQGWILEPEGEKCAELPVAAGVVTISQPGHAHSVDQIRSRYEALLNGGAPGVVYLADNDQAGGNRANQATEAAASEGMPIIVLHAGDLWPDLPAGGSIDDAPGTTAEQIKAIEVAAKVAHARMVKAPLAAKRLGEQEQPQQQQPLTLAEIREQLETAVTEGISSTDLEVQTLALAGSSGQSPASLKGLLRSIGQEHEARLGIAAEKHNLLTEVDRRELGQGITLDYLFDHRLAEALRVVCRTLPADASSAGLAYLTSIAGLVKLGGEVIASKAADFKVPLNLYAASVGVSGAKKSPLRKRLVKSPAAPLMLELALAHKRAINDWTEQNRGVKPAERPDPPEAVHLQVSDFTIEALAEQLQRQEARGLSLLINRDELSGLFGSFGAYKGGRGGDEQHLLEAYDGGGFTSLRVSMPGGGRFYERCNLSIYGTIQPAVLQKLVANGDDSGLWARFIFAPLPAKVVPLPEEETEQQQQEAEAAEAVLANVCRAVYLMPRVSLGLDPDARRAFTRYEESCQHEVLRAPIAAQSALWGKSGGKVLRIAGLLHLLQLAAPGGNAGKLISPDTMQRAIAFVDHLNGWTLSLHAGVRPQGPGDIMRIVHRIATDARQPIRWSDVNKGLSPKQRKEIDSAAVRLAMEALADMKVGETEVGGRGALTYRATAPLS